MVICDLCKCLCDALCVFFFINIIKRANAQFIAFALNKSFEMRVNVILASLVCLVYSFEQLSVV
jgi:hypothetical protein